jgi:hypothetical protein
MTTRIMRLKQAVAPCPEAKNPEFLVWTSGSSVVRMPSILRFSSLENQPRNYLQAPPGQGRNAQPINGLPKRMPLLHFVLSP